MPTPRRCSRQGGLAPPRAGGAPAPPPRPVGRLRGGQAALDLGNYPDLDLGSQVSTSTHQRHRTPFWLTGEEPPARKSVSEQGDMVMLQGFNWKIL